MSVPIHMEMHCDHQHRLNEIGLWQEQLNHWRGELQESLRNMERLQTALTCHEQALQKHAQELDHDCTSLHEHEHALAEFERGETGMDLVSLAQKHRDERSRQDERRAVHERIKKHHHSLMAQWHLLFGALTKPM